MRAAILGFSGPVLSDDEAALLRAEPPAGIILFGRNLRDPEQARSLTRALRRHLLAEAVLMVDQEGGRVARLRPPHWQAHPPAAELGRLHERDPAAGERAAWLTGALIGLDCRDAGFDVACAPVLDRRVPGAHDVIGDRAFSADVDRVATLARAVADGMLAAGVQPVGKHVPGHGRAGCDSHLDLPSVAAVPDEDLIPFTRLHDLPWMMTAHILYEDWDRQRPGTVSPVVIDGIVRGRIGFQGVLVSDDLAMKALSGAPATLACAALAAGCDLALYCDGDPAANQAISAAVPVIGPATRDRLARARRLAEVRRCSLDAPALAEERTGLLA